MSYGEQAARDFFFSELEEIFAYIAGDDVQVTGLEEYINEVAKNCQKTHAPDANVGVYGLGQVAKEPMINDGDYFDFLSKDCYFDGEYKITRKVDRVINKAGYSLNVGKRVH
jgi:hypothetical protein